MRSVSRLSHPLLVPKQGGLQVNSHCELYQTFQRWKLFHSDSRAGSNSPLLLLCPAGPWFLLCVSFPFPREAAPVGGRLICSAFFLPAGVWESEDFPSFWPVPLSRSSSGQCFCGYNGPQAALGLWLGSCGEQGRQRVGYQSCRGPCLRCPPPPVSPHPSFNTQGTASRGRGDLRSCLPAPPSSRRPRVALRLNSDAASERLSAAARSKTAPPFALHAPSPCFTVLHSACHPLRLPSTSAHPMTTCCPQLDCKLGWKGSWSVVCR